MRHRIWVDFALVVALMAPALAQQTDTSNQTSPAAPSAAQAQDNQAATTQAPADQSSASNLEPLQSERHEGFWGKINPMARKKYVQRQLQPVRDRVNELDELTADNSKAIKDVDARAQQGIQMASARANQADQHAIDAGNRAQTADQTAQQANTRLQTVQTAVSNSDQYQPVTETEIRLAPGQTVLSKKAKDALDEMADSVKGQSAYLFEVQGFSSGRGAAAIENSQRIAQTVVRYLVENHDVPIYRVHLLGMGNAPLPATSEGGTVRRTVGNRVEISLLKNPHLEQLASATPLQAQGGATNAYPSSQGGATGTTAQPVQPSGTDSNTNPQPPASDMNTPTGRP